MASTGIQNGTDVSVYIGGTQIMYGVSNDFEFTMDTRETTNKNSGGAAEFGESKTSWSMSVEALFAEDAGYGFNDVLALIKARTKVTVRESSEVSGDKYRNGEAWITNISKSSPLEDNITYSISIQGTGVLNITTLT